jgi:hypothetical protein
MAGPGFLEAVGLPSSSDAFCFTKLRHDTEQLHHAQSVPVDPTFYHLATSEADDAHSGDGDLLSGWCNSVQIALMRTATSPPGHNCFAFPNHVLDREAKVSEGVAVERDSLLLTLGPRPTSGVEHNEVVYSVVLSKARNPTNRQEVESHFNGELRRNERTLRLDPD